MAPDIPATSATGENYPPCGFRTITVDLILFYKAPINTSSHLLTLRLFDSYLRFALSSRHVE